MSKIIIRGDVVINVYVNSAEEAAQLTKNGLNIAEILQGAVKVSKADADDLPDFLKAMKAAMSGDCDCSGCQMKRRIEALGVFTDGEENFENLAVGLDKYGFINEEMESEDLINIINSYAVTIEEGGKIEVGEGKFLVPIVPVSAVTH